MFVLTTTDLVTGLRVLHRHAGCPAADDRSVESPTHQVLLGYWEAERDRLRSAPDGRVLFGFCLACKPLPVGLTAVTVEDLHRVAEGTGSDRLDRLRRVDGVVRTAILDRAGAEGGA